MDQVKESEIEFIQELDGIIGIDKSVERVICRVVMARMWEERQIRTNC